MRQSVNFTSPFLQTLRRWLLRGALAACCTAVIGLALIYIFLQRDPAALIESYLATIEQQTGLKFSIGSVDVTLLPLPAMSISDLRIAGNGLEASASWATARPSFRRIMAGDFLPGSITILRPKLRVVTDLPLNDPDVVIARIKTLLPTAQKDARIDLPGDFDITVNQFNAEITGTHNTKLTLTGLQCNLGIRQSGEVDGEISIPGIRMFDADKPLASVEHLQVSGGASFNKLIAATHSLKIRGEAYWRGILRSSQFILELEKSAPGWSGRGKIIAALDAGGASVPFSLTGQINIPSDSDLVAGTGFDWQIGPDSGRLDLLATVPANLADTSVSGTLSANRISLTEWFGFARNLCPGLQIALDNITRSSLEFVANSQGLQVKNIIASCSGSTFSGTGAVQDWSKPVVRLDLSAPSANLGTALPEALAETPDAPWYPHPPLTPLPTEPLQAGETGIGYDIRLAADTTTYGPVKFENASVRIHPGKLDKTGFHDVLIDAKGKFYGGTVNGACILGADPGLPYCITAKADNIEGAPLAKAMPILPFRQGRFDASATVTSKGKKLNSFLANLKGEMKANGENATLAESGPKEIFSDLDASCRLRSAVWDGKRLKFDGQWRAALSSKVLAASCEANGNLYFGAGGMTFSNLPSTLELKTSVAPLPENTRMKLTGNFSGRPDQGKFEISRGRLELLGQTIHGDLSLDTNKNPPTFQGAMRAEIKDLNSAFARFGIKTGKLPSGFNNLKLEGDCSGSSDAFRLTKIRAKCGSSGITGSLRLQARNKRPHLETELVVDKLELSQFSQGSKPGVNPWDFRGLTSFDASGSLAAKELTIWDLRFLNARFNYRLENGKLSTGSIDANFYGAPLKGNINANFQKGLSFDASMIANGFSLSEAAKARQIGALLTGMASMDARINASLDGNMKLASALNGKWAFSVANGSWQGRGKNGAPKGKPTTFRSIRASGIVNQGVVKSSDFSLAGDGLKVMGGGTLNLANQEVNCNFDVDMKGLPDFPLRLYGPLANTKTSIGAGKLALNAIGELVSGFAGAVGGVLKGAWSIFSK